jgi:hypothetical protein
MFQTGLVLPQQKQQSPKKEEKLAVKEVKVFE